MNAIKSPIACAEAFAARLGIRLPILLEMRTSGMSILIIRMVKKF
jgi:hypothetical protein